MISALLVYAIIAAIGVLFLAVSAVFSFEHGGAGDGSDGIGPASPTMLSVFATVFGVVGIVLTATFEMDARATPFVALLVALPVYGGSYWTLNRFLKQGGANSSTLSDLTVRARLRTSQEGGGTRLALPQPLNSLRAHPYAS
jgi:hypothetical protein